MDAILLDTYGTQQDLQKYGIEFEEGKQYLFWKDDLEDNPLVFTGTVNFDSQIQKWIAVVDDASIKNLSETPFDFLNET
jgi:hypothetical protein